MRLDGFSTGGGILAAEAGGDGWSTHGLDCNIGGEGPQVSVGDDSGGSVLFSYGLEKVKGGGGKTSVGTEGTLTGVGESHGGVGAATGELSGGVDSGVVPAEADEDGSAVLFGDEGLEVGFDIGERHGCFGVLDRG